ncbi:MAG: hypothetical protein B0D89_00465 [Candidatus Sedimenticola endophacoides]|uniref:CheR-type methyltransferase domain-containing protein n=1 Tax=Candidatus Sedimenticola endophacoides TaxID=2548426 RepID=A0A6N4DVX0_9GAMM|nr:MAG: hypothetical protein B0D89_00465 [Candidatus Sedimenticola endophacoides]PUE02361.1 MAG: hypothetical protein C3L24_06235 [Candidatus Sedimenticola endophacoides]
MRLLEQLPGDSGEWERLIGELTVNETYFFRDRGQFKLLRYVVLPKLIEGRRAHGRLRVWSAGCSTGEEIYSLAILLDHLLAGESGAWRLELYGTDIDARAIDHARRGCYRDWSFRGVDPQLQQGYFTSRGGEWTLLPRIHDMVRFHKANLLASVEYAPELPANDFDLILCRNVFIYFDREAIARVVGRLSAALAPDGYLLTGHNELFEQHLPQLETVVFPESVIYRRRGGAGEQPASAHPFPMAASRAPPKPPRPVSLTRRDSGRVPVVPDPARSAAAPTDLTRAQALYEQGAYAAAAEMAERAAGQRHDAYEGCCLRARCLANLARYEEALRVLEEALRLNDLAHEPYYLMAHIREAQGRTAEALGLLDRVIYLDPAFIPAYLDLAALHERMDNGARSRKLREVALRLIERLPLEAEVPPYSGLTVAELKAYVTELIGPPADTPSEDNRNRGGRP